MRLHTRSWGAQSADPIVCVHGVNQHGGIFASLGERLARQGRFVVAVDLRGHGASGHEPPWNVDTHADDLLETLDDVGLGRPSWIAHSFGARVVAALAARAPERASRLALLEPGLQVPPERALRQAEIDRLDWSFASPESAINAMLTSDTVVAAPPETVAAYVRDDVRRGSDGRFRFSPCPSAVVVAWSEMTLPPPPIAELPTLLVGAMAPLIDGRDVIRRYRAALGSLLTVATVPNGHNVLWESPVETTAAIEAFLAATDEPAAATG